MEPLVALDHEPEPEVMNTVSTPNRKTLKTLQETLNETNCAVHRSREREHTWGLKALGLEL